MAERKVDMGNLDKYTVALRDIGQYVRPGGFASYRVEPKVSDSSEAAPVAVPTSFVRRALERRTA